MLEEDEAKMGRKNGLHGRVVAILCMVLMLSGVPPVYGQDNSIDELAKGSIVVYGHSLSEEQKAKTRKLLKVKDGSASEVTINGTDLIKYIGEGSKDALVYSSVQITPKEKGHGITLSVVTKENITKLNTMDYINALQTSGARDMVVTIASPVAVSGHSALAGVYKAMEMLGTDLSVDRTKLAYDELGIKTYIADEYGGEEWYDSAKFAEAIEDIKKDVFDAGVGREVEIPGEDIKGLIQNALVKQGLDAKFEEIDERKIYLYAIKYNRESSRYGEEFTGQISEISKEVSGGIKEGIGAIGDSVKGAVEKEGFWEELKAVFTDAFEAVVKFYKSLKETDVAEK